MPCCMKWRSEVHLQIGEHRGEVLPAVVAVLELLHVLRRNVDVRPVDRQFQASPKAHDPVDLGVTLTYSPVPWLTVLCSKPIRSPANRRQCGPCTYGFRAPCAKPSYRECPAGAPVPSRRRHDATWKTGTWRRTTCARASVSGASAFQLSGEADIGSAGTHRPSRASCGRTCRTRRTSGSPVRFRRSALS